MYEINVHKKSTSMKDQHRLSFQLKNQIFLILMLVSSVAFSQDGMKVVVNDKQFNASDSLRTSDKGILKLDAVSSKAGMFKVVIRHVSQSAGLIFTTLDERYLQGEIFESVDLEKILIKANDGDQILIYPVTDESQTSCQPIVIHVLGDEC
jgi:hypothetical protein